MINPYAKRTSQRLTITLPWNVHQRTIALSNDQGRSLSNLAAYLIERALDEFFPDTRNPS
jgi:predicted DNA-binding protein